jgi:probable F420-dependent oxidoreductase
MVAAQAGGMATNSDRAFRFGIVAAQARDGEQWAQTARQVESLGYRSLLIPDNLHGLAPFVALSAAATATSTLTVGSYVLAAPYRSAQDVAWSASTLALLSGNRFELGLGAGRPAAAGEAEQLGRPFGSFAERVDQVAETIAAMRHRAPAVRILVAGSGDRLLRLAAEHADVVALGLPPRAGEDELAAKVARLRELAGDRFDQIELNVNLLAIGDETPPWLRQYIGADVAELAAQGSAAVLTGSVEQMAETLQRRRETCGISYVATNAAFMTALAPVVDRLDGS